MKHLFGKVAG